MAEDHTSDGFIPSMFKPAALLPIAKYRDQLLYTIETFQVTVVIGQTGSGKTTQLPQFLDKAGWCADGKAIAVTQPRRVAATSVAMRVAEEVGCKVGEDVGYSIRFEDVTSAKTRIKFLTDGLLLREALVDPLLSRYSVIMVDEAHERSLSSDILLGILKKIKRKRPELRIVVSSATLQAEEFLRFFDVAQKPTSELNGDSISEAATGTGTIFYLGGRMYPVDIQYLEEPAEDYVARSVKTVFDIHNQEGPGDILVFLTGREEIDNAAQEITSLAQETLHPRAQALLPVPLYAGLTSSDQMAVFDPAPPETRKVVLATNIAEASVTIDGIVYVLDCGYVKLRAYNPVTSIETLTAVPVSKASATQRAGRAGRTKPGKCYRLYTASAYASLPDTTVPEIQRSDLAPTILQLKALGVDNIVRFDFLTPPPSELISRALDLLFSLHALDEYAKLTRPLGTRMAELALDPMTAAALLSASSFGCLDEMLSITAMITSTRSSSSSVWISHDGERKSEDSARRKFAAEEGDHLTLLNVYVAFAAASKRKGGTDGGLKWCRDNRLNFRTLSGAVSVRNQLRRHLERFGVDVSGVPESQTGAVTVERIQKCLTTGYFAHAARMQPDGTFRSVNGGTTLHAHPSSLLFNRKADWVIFSEAVETSSSKTFIRDITKVEKGWLVECAPQFYSIRSGR